MGVPLNNVDGYDEKRVLADCARRILQADEPRCAFEYDARALARGLPSLVGERERLEQALREIESIAAEHEGVTSDAYELITDRTRQALAASSGGATDGR